MATGPTLSTANPILHVCGEASHRFFPRFVRLNFPWTSKSLANIFDLLHGSSGKGLSRLWIGWVSSKLFFCLVVFSVIFFGLRPPFRSTQMCVSCSQLTTNHPFLGYPLFRKLPSMCLLLKVHNLFRGLAFSVASSTVRAFPASGVLLRMGRLEGILGMFHGYEWDSVSI